jgi:hypothetical protein
VVVAPLALIKVVVHAEDFENCTFSPDGSVTYPAVVPQLSVFDQRDTVDIIEPSGRVFFVMVGFARRFCNSSSKTSHANQVHGSENISKEIGRIF